MYMKYIIICFTFFSATIIRGRPLLEVLKTIFVHSFLVLVYFNFIFTYSFIIFNFIGPKHSQKLTDKPETLHCTVIEKHSKGVTQPKKPAKYWLILSDLPWWFLFYMRQLLINLGCIRPYFMKIVNISQVFYSLDYHSF